MKRLLICCTALFLSMTALIAAPTAAAPAAQGPAPTGISQPPPPPPERNLLERTHPGLFDPALYRLSDSRPEASDSGQTAWLERFALRFWQERSSIVVLHLLLAGILTGLLVSQRRRLAKTPELPFFLRHPLASSLFVSTAALAHCYRQPSSGWHLLLTALAVGAAVPLLNELYASPLQRLAVRLAAMAFVLVKVIQTLPNPQLQSLWLAGLCLAGIFASRRMAARAFAVEPQRLLHFRYLLTGVMALLVLVFLALAGGYVPLAQYLVDAGFTSLVTCLLAGLVLHGLQAGVQLAAGLPLFARPGFLHRHGGELLKRLGHLAKLAVLAASGIYLTVAWRLFDSFSQAWHGIIGAGVALGDHTVSARMILVGLGTLYLTVLFSWLLRSLLEEEVFPRSQVDRGVRDSINKLLHYALLGLGTLMALSLAGIELKNFAVLAGALGIGIGFGLQNIVNNFVSGLILLFERPIKIGDMIVLDGDWGEVRKIGLRSTTVETFDQSEVIVPNSVLVSEKVTNWTLSNEQCRVVIPVGVAYGSDIEKVLQILYEAADQQPEVLETPPPSAVFTAFGASSLDFELRVWARSVSQRVVIKSDLLLYIDRRFREAKIEIPFPQRDLHLRSVEEGLLEAWSPPKNS